MDARFVVGWVVIIACTVLFIWLMASEWAENVERLHDMERSL